MVDPHIKELFLNIIQFISLFYDKNCRTSRLFRVKKFVVGKTQIGKQKCRSDCRTCMASCLSDISSATD